ncbi:hypothetical protein CBS101457_004993 [Exobasidium rhododendri]|nr:hypothetical protein CBS101457_004993 [Exobasidium rhododendri]
MSATSAFAYRIEVVDYTLLAGAGAVLLCCYVFYNLCLHPLAGLPGPFIARSGLWSYRINRAIRLDASHSLDQLHTRYGDYVRIGRNHVLTVDPDALQPLYGHGSKWRKSNFYHLFRLGSAKGIMSETNVKKHAALRRASANAYSFNSLLELEGSVDRMADLFFTKVDTFADSQQPWDAGLWLQWFAMDMVGELAFGRSFDLVKTASDPNSLMQAVDTFTVVATLLGSMPRFGDPFFTLASALGAGGKGAAYLMKVTVDAVRDRLKRTEQNEKEGGSADEEKDMLSKFLAVKDSETGKRQTFEQLCTSATQIIGAGSDTTSISMRAIIYYTLTTPGVYGKLMAELTEAHAADKLHFPTSYKEGVQLEYFQAIVKEALRCYPAVPWIMARVCPEEGAVLGGHAFPAGTCVGMSAYCFHRRAYGPDSTVFRPERWIEADIEQRKQMEKNFLSFGGGSRVCIGKNISIMEMTKLIPYLFWKYKFKILPRAPGSPHKHKHGRGLDGVKDGESWYVQSAWFASQRDFFLTVRKRGVES